MWVGMLTRTAKNEVPYDPAVPLISVSSKRDYIVVLKSTCSPVSVHSKLVGSKRQTPFLHIHPLRKV